jgi:hypothetical protein
MAHVDLNQPATVAFGGEEKRFEQLLNAISYAFETCPEADRRQMMVTTQAGQRLGWREVLALYEEHLEGP